MAEFTLTDAQSGAQLNVRVGDTITIRLSENAAAGYRWMVAALDQTHVAATNPRYQPGGAGIGTAGTAIWTFTPTHAGNTRIELRKSRPWESGDSASERFAVELEIGE